MHRRNTILALCAFALLPLPARGEIKAYDLDVLIVLNTTTLTVTGDTGRNFRFGEIAMDDGSNGSPTLDLFRMRTQSNTSTRTDVFAGLNSFVHIRTLSTIDTLPGQTGRGDSEGFVQWNPLSSWTPFGGSFCKGSNELGNPLGAPICAVAGPFSPEMTLAASVPSATFDLPVWSFDAMGDFSSDSYLWTISSNRSGNLEYFLRGHLQTNLPALSGLGFIALGGSLLLVGVRALRRRDPE